MNLLSYCMENHNMKHLILRCAELNDLQQLHRELKELLNLPSYYGENFDALYDCLTEIGEPVCLEVCDLKASNLGPAGRVLQQVLLDADERNPNLDVVFSA